jgi:hypothetical protein
MDSSAALREQKGPVGNIIESLKMKRTEPRRKAPVERKLRVYAGNSIE